MPNEKLNVTQTLKRAREMAARDVPAELERIHTEIKELAVLFIAQDQLDAASRCLSAAQLLEGIQA